ncbi:MAG: hypothetical protein K2X52_18980 [Mycobacteriaceae bacterium]|nr:hypothetical protein [Mycobacteriaceae bacterium]
MTTTPNRPDNRLAGLVSGLGLPLLVAWTAVLYLWRLGDSGWANVF